MTDTISFRPTVQDREVLARLGESPTEAIRAALAIARRSLVDEELRSEAARLAADPAERAKAEAVSAFMGDTVEGVLE